MKTILLIVVIFVIFLVNSGIVERFDLSEHYRLGDIVRMEKHRKALTPVCYKKYPESIASEYIKRTNKDNDIPTLIDIIDKYPNKTPQKAIIIHLRIGDVIDETGYSIKEILHHCLPFYKNQKSCYVKPLSYYNSINFRTFPTKKIILVGGFHKNGDHTKSYEYVIAIRNFFRQKGYDVETRIDVENDPDSDFVYMCNAKYFVSSGGGFSGIIKKIVAEKGNHAI